MHSVVGACRPVWLALRSPFDEAHAVTLVRELVVVVPPSAVLALSGVRRKRMARENVDAAVGDVGDVDAAGAIDRDPLRTAELAIARAQPAELGQELSCP